ncbi:MAG: hypothetical protein HKN35_09470, partial [Woeseia sp.]|nr:hypothetical protein [Woeseia sp.]
MESKTVPIWVHEMLLQIEKSDCATFALVVLLESAVIESTLSAVPGRRWYDPPLMFLDKFAGALYNWLDRKRSGYRDAFVPTSCEELLSDAPVLEVQPHSTESAYTYDRVALEKIGDYDIDVFLNLSACTLSGDILGSARYGLWVLHHGSHLLNRGGP